MRPEIRSNKIVFVTYFTAAWLVAWPFAASSAPFDIPVPELSYELTKLDKPVTAPAFELPNMDDENHTLSQYRGNVVMLNFWATWCPPCRREMPSMETLAQTFKDKPFKVIAINEWESEEIVFPYLGQIDLAPSFPILFDKSGAIAEKYNVRGLPTTFIINKQGQIVYRAIGGRDFNHQEVRKILMGLM